MKADKTQSYELIKVLLVAVGLLALWHLKFLVLTFFSAFVLTVVLMPFVRLLKKAKIPSPFAILIPLIVFTTLLIITLNVFLPNIRDEITELAVKLPEIIGLLPFVEQFNITAESMREIVTRRLGDPNEFIFSLGATAIKLSIGLLTLLIVTMYWMGSYDRIKRVMLTYLPSSRRTQAKDIWTRIENKLGKWFLGQLLVGATVGLMVWVSLTLLGVPFAGTLATLAFLLEFIPIAGPILASVPAILIALSDSVEKALLTVVLYIIIQQIESHLVTPMLMGKTVKLHPIVIIVAVLAGGLLFGIIGALIAVPAALVISAFIDNYRGEKLPGNST